MSSMPETRYAKSGDTYIAYQVIAHKKSIASGVANSSAERARISSMGIVG